MRSKAVAVTVAMMMAVLLVACRGHEDNSVTGSYGTRVISGQAVMAPGSDNGSVAGVQVTVSGTGMTTTLGPDGRFTFAGVPDNAELHFSRAADAVDTRLAISGTSAGPLHVALESSSHGHHRSSGSVPAQQVEGLITAVSGTSITIHDEHGNDVTLAITPSTIIRKGRTNVKPADLAKGMRVHAKAVMVSGTNTALEIIVQDENTTEPPDNGGTTMTANGTVTAVGSTSLTVDSEDHGSVTVNVDKHTIIRKQGVVIQLTDIKVGDEVNTMGTKVDDHTLNAIQIEVRGVSKH